MTLRASQPGVFPLQRIPGFVVIECFGRRVPLDEVEIWAVVLGMAARAVPASAALANQRCVQAALLGQTLGNFHVAFETFQIGFPRADFVTARALGWPAEGSVRSGKRAGGNLGPPGSGQQQSDQTRGRKAAQRAQVRAQWGRARTGATRSQTQCGT